MNIQISEIATKQLEALIGTSDPSQIASVVEQFAQNEQLVLAAMLERRNEADIRQSAAECDTAMESLNVGEGQPFGEAMQDIADNLGLELRR